MTNLDTLKRLCEAGKLATDGDWQQDVDGVYHRVYTDMPQDGAHPEGVIHIAHCDLGAFAI